MTPIQDVHSRIVELAGDTWRVLNTGAYADGLVFVHLASTTQVVDRRNGRYPATLTTQVSAELVERALGKPRGFYSWNRSLRGAFERGERAHAEGLSIRDCPYEDKRKDNGRLTWSRAYRTAWVDGFKHASVNNADRGAFP